MDEIASPPTKLLKRLKDQDLWEAAVEMRKTQAVYFPLFLSSLICVSYKRVLQEAKKETYIIIDEKLGNLFFFTKKSKML